MRILCLGNELLADDVFGLVVAGELGRRLPHLDVVCSTASGFHLIDHLAGIELLVVVDTIQMGSASPGTLYVLRSSDLQCAQGPSPHYTGLMETLELARELSLDFPQHVVFLAVEAADCLTVGGKMHDAVKSAVDVAVDLVAEIARKVPSACPQIDFAARLAEAVTAVSGRWGSGRIMFR